jgi:hypothetical protein
MIINLKTSEETKNLYDEISKNLNDWVLKFLKHMYPFESEWDTNCFLIQQEKEYEKQAYYHTIISVYLTNFMMKRITVI